MAGLGVNVRARSPAVARNRAPILEVLRGVLPARGLVLELACGTGEHAAFFAQALPSLEWQPTDKNATGFAGVEAHRAAAGAPNLRPPLVLDATAASWPVPRAEAVVSINMIHIAPWAATKGLIAGAARTLVDGGVLFVYGPFKRGGAHTAESNRRFDEDLRARDSSWGVRDLDDVTALAADHGFRRTEVVAMPANNLSVVFVSDAARRA
jgi:SAM-dependent methyltransferase